MRFPLAGVFVLFVSCLSAQEQQLQIKGGDVRIVEVDRTIIVKDKLQVATSFPFTLSAPAGAFDYAWKYPASITTNEKDDLLEITAAPKGTYTVSVKVTDIDWNAKKFTRKTYSLTFAVQEPGPTPKPPDPKPPDPGPDTAPFPAQQFTVMFIRETAAKLTPEQRAIFTSVLIRDYLNRKCPKLNDGQTSFRMWDYDEDASGDLDVFQAAWKVKPERSKLPWLLISDGKGKGFSGPLPATVAATLELLKKWGGE